MFNALKGLVGGPGGGGNGAGAGGGGGGGGGGARGRSAQAPSAQGAIDYDQVTKGLDKALFTPSYDACGILLVRAALPSGCALALLLRPS